MSVSRNEYMRARRNAQARYNRLVNKGYGFDTNPIPAIPKRITEGSIRRLNQLTAKELREKASYGIIGDTGEIVTAKEAYINQRRETYARQSKAQRLSYWRREGKAQYAERILGRKRYKGESYKDYYDSAIAHEADYLYEYNKAEEEREERYKSSDEYHDDYYTPPEQIEWIRTQRAKREFYEKQEEIFRKHDEKIKQILREEYGVDVPAEWSPADLWAYYHYVRGYGGPHPELPNDAGFTPTSSSPFDKMTEEEYAIEIENAYDSGEYEMARDLENERDYYYPKKDDNIADIGYESRLLDAIDIVKQYSPEVGAKLEESFQYYMDRKDAVAFEQGLSKQQMEAFHTALAQAEYVKYSSNEMALWTIYTKIDYAINSRHHSKAERMQFFGRLQSGDFQYE